MRPSWFVALLSLTFASACVGGTDYTPPPCSTCVANGDAGVDGGSDAGADAGTDAGFDAGTDAGSDAGLTLTVGEWNLEFFGKPDAGPSDDALQASNVATVMGQTNADIWALEEVCDDSQTYFNQVISTLKSTYGEDYAYVLANDPSIGNAYAGYGGSWGQKTAVVYRKSIATKLDAQLVYRTDIDSSWGSTFSSRDPLEVHLQLATPAGARDIYVIAVHLKSGSDSTSYGDRQKEADDLKAYLDGSRATDSVIVAGDWNDDLNQSITSCSGSPCATPFANLLADTANYDFVTRIFDTNGENTTVHYSSAIDHHLITNELIGNYVSGSARVEYPDQASNTPYISNYSTTTSDHYPTLARYHFP